MPYVEFERQDDPVAYDREWDRQATAERRERSKFNGSNQLPTDREADWRRNGINLTYHEYELMLAACGGKCQVCDIHVGKSGCVDHNHDTGKIRGILCKKCNMMIENARDIPYILFKGAAYLAERG